MECNVSFSAPADPRGGKIHHVFRCDRVRGHDGQHAQLFPAASLTTASRLTASLRADAVIAPQGTAKEPQSLGKEAGS